MHLISRLALSVLALIVTTLGASAQFDTTNTELLVWGKLISSSSSQVVVDATRPDGSTGQMAISVVAETQISGCTLDSVVAGTYTLVMLNPQSSSPLADLIKFEGCAPLIGVMARVTGLNGSVLDVQSTQQSELGASGLAISVQTSSATSIFSCDGYALQLSDLTPNTEIALNGTGTASNFTATSIQTVNDCSQAYTAEVTFVEFRAVESLFVVAITGTTDTLALKIDAFIPGGRGDSSIALYSCDGQLLSIDALQPGDPLSIAIIDSPRRGKFLQYAQLQRNCPIHVAGTISAINGNEVTVAGNDGQLYAATVTNETTVTSCTKRETTRDDLAVGQTVNATIVETNTARTYTVINVVDDCSFAFYVQGTVKMVTDSFIVVNGYMADGSQRDLELGVSPGTLTVNCLNEPQAITAVQPGNTVGVYYSTSQGVSFADLVSVLDPCTIAYIGGTIEAVTPTSIALFSDGPQATVTLTYDGTTTFADCTGQTITIDSSMIGAQLFGVYNTASDPQYLMSATISIGCPTYGNVEGTVVGISDSVIVVQTPAGSETFVRSVYVSVYDTLMLPIEWSAIELGQTVCMTVDEQARIALRVFVDQACDALPNGPRMSKAVGKVVSATATTIDIDTRSGVTTYMLTDDTRMMTSSQTSITLGDVTAGAMVSVMCMDHTPTGMPIAASVVLMSTTTSVDDESSSASTLVLAPNPASTSITLAGDAEITRATIIDMQGRTVMVASSRTLDVSQLPVGTYTVQVATATGMQTMMMQVVR